jgi:hypothetical protein
MDLDKTKLNNLPTHFLKMPATTDYNGWITEKGMDNNRNF